jgi:hypothetical protein
MKPTKARVLHYTSLERFASNNHSLFATFISYEENEVFRMWLQGPYTQCLIFVVNYKLARVLHSTSLERFAIHNHSCLLDPVISYKENEVF